MGEEDEGSSICPSQWSTIRSISSLDSESLTISPLLFLSLTCRFHCTTLFRLIYMLSLNPDN